MRFSLPQPTAHLDVVAALGAMIICAAVVLDLGPFAKGPGGGGVAATLDEPRVTAELIDVNSLPPWQTYPPVSVRLTQSSFENQDFADLAAASPAPLVFSVEAGSRALQASKPKEGEGAVDGYGSIDPFGEAAFDRTNAEKPTIVGVWAPDADTCSASNFRGGVLPTVINAEGAWAGDTFCLFTKKKETETGWNVVARCSTPRERWTSQVRLTVSERRLTWTSKRGTQSYTRCPADVLMAQAR